MSTRHHELAPPPRRALIRETRTVVDVAMMVGPLLGAQLRPRTGRRGSHVIAVPGFGSDDRYLAPLRHYLRCHGFGVEGWGLGKNLAGIDLPHTLDDLSEAWEIPAKADYRGEGSVPYLCDRLKERVRARHAEIGKPVSLVGWSLGGYLARETARDLPGIVDRVVTLGSPTIGGPKYTAAATFFRKRGMDLDWIERQIRRRESRPIRQPITAIYSRSDAVVSWQAAIDHHSDDVTHVEVDAAHLGMGFNPRVWRHILRALEADVGLISAE